MANDVCTERSGGLADGAQEVRTGGLGGRGQNRRSQADSADKWTGGLADGADGQTSGRGSRPGFKRRHSFHLISLLGA